VAVTSLRQQRSCRVTVVVVVMSPRWSCCVRWPRGIAVAAAVTRLDGGGGGGRIATAAVVSCCGSHVAWQWWRPSHGLTVVVVVASLRQSCRVVVTMWHGGGGGGRVVSWWLHSTRLQYGHAHNCHGHGASSGGARSARPPPTAECMATRRMWWRGHGKGYTRWRMCICKGQRELDSA
jgi:hypothetical protein